MKISNDRHDANLGREDRLVRGCVALSLALLGLFTVLASGHITFVLVGFVALTTYVAWTAFTGWDPLYARLGVDTHIRPVDADDREQEPRAEWVSALMDR